MTEKPLQVFLVEDSAGDARLLREMFRMEEPGSFELTHLLHIMAERAWKRTIFDLAFNQIVLCAFLHGLGGQHLVVQSS
jgi:hypothetical protein